MDEQLYEAHAGLEGGHWWFTARRSVLDAILGQALAADPDHDPATTRILDVGCGSGGVFGALVPHGTVTGIDMSPEMVEHCRQRYGDRVTVQLGDLPDDLPRDGSYDVVGAFDVIEHIVDDVGTLSRMREATRPGGIVMIAVPAFPILWGQTDVLSHHVRRYRAPQLRRALEAAGLRVERTTYFNTWLFPAIAAVRIGSRLLRPNKEPSPDLEMTGSRSDRILEAIFASERHVVRRHSLPFGVSLAAIARRPLLETGP